MALDDILTKLQTVRTKMTASVQNKGVAVPADSTLYTIDKGIGMIPQRSSMKLYKCASVDTTNKTWTGYELLLQDGVYVVSDIETTGLIYSSVVPVIGCIYTQDALIKIDTFYSGWKAPTESLIFHAPLEAQTTTAETGQTIEYRGNAYTSFTQEDGVPCVYFGDGDGTYCRLWDNESDHPIVSISFWIKTDNTASEHFPFTTSREAPGSQWYYTNRCSYTDVLSYSGLSYEFDNMKFNHICITRNDSQYTLYVNGVLSDTSTNSSDGFGSYLVLHGDHWGAGERHNYAPIYMAAVRVYERVLTQDEITTLATEFTPTTA